MLRYQRNWAKLPIDTKDPSLVLYLPLWYPYSDMIGSTIYSYDKNRHSCTVTGASWEKDGRSFDGDDNILLPTVSALDPTTGTIMFWLKLGRTGTAEYLYSNSVDELSLYHNGSQFRMYYNLIAAFDWTYSVVVDGWAHLAFTFAPSATGIGYENAVQKASGACDVAYTGGTKRIGTISGAGSTWFLGSIGEFLMYNRQLTAGEITRHYQVTKWRYL